MEDELAPCVEAVRAALRTQHVAVHARVEPCEGILCGYRDGVIRLALPTTSTAEGRLRATMLGALMGLDEAQVAWLFRALLPRLIAHEFGHALRDESGRCGREICVEEQAADRLATLVSRPMIDARDASSAREMLGGVVAKLGGLHEAAALHRHSAEIRARWGLGASDEATARARERLQTNYWRDLSAYLRLTAAWAWIDLTLDTEDDFDAFRREHFARGTLGLSRGRRP